MNRDSLIQQIETINVWKKGGERAVHKPLLLLYALGRCQRGDVRLISYHDIHRDVLSLIEAFGPNRKTSASYPFYHLQSDGLWEIENTAGLERIKNSCSFKHKSLLENNASGGFPDDIYSYILAHNEIIPDLAKSILTAHFPETLHDDITLSVGITPDPNTATRSIRDPKFREQVLEAYEYKCAICGYNLRVGHKLVGLEAAHIKWHQAGGPDVCHNGIALCSLHHKLFDYGAFTLSDHLTVEVSRKANGDYGKDEWLMKFQGKKIREPQSKLYLPEDTFIQWHIKEVFKETYRPG